MQKTYTSVLARRVRIDGEFATLPYEAGWASEAVFFIQTEGEHPELEGMLVLRRGNRLSITPVSPAQWRFITERLLAQDGH